MKFKKNILKFSILAGVLACLLVAGCLFASGTTAAQNAATDKLNVILSVPSAPVAEGGTFVATVKIANTDIASFKLAGLQVAVKYDTAALTTSNSAITHTLDTDESIAVSNVTGGEVKFVCVKNEFTEEAGYTALSDLFTVTFTANKAIANPATLFDAEDITYLMGDTKALEIATSNKVYGADKEAIALAILGSELELVVSENVGTVVVAPTPAGTTAMTKTELESAVSGATASTDVIGTGSKITVDGVEAEVVVKGDVDGDGIVTVYDAMMIQKALAENAADEDKFAENDIKEFAGDVDATAGTTTEDASAVLGHVVGDLIG